MNTYSKEEKYLKVIEGIGQLLLIQDERNKFNEYEIEALKKKLKSVEEYLNHQEREII